MAADIVRTVGHDSRPDRGDLTTLRAQLNLLARVATALMVRGSHEHVAAWTTTATAGL
jgi:hypothetical protein